MDRRFIRTGLVVTVLAVAGWLMGDAANRGDAVLFTVELLIATAIVAVITSALGPVQRADERARRRSEQAALLAVRVSVMIGVIAGAYAQILNTGDSAVAFTAGMIVPGIIWFVAYWILNWRDTNGKD